MAAQMFLFEIPPFQLLRGKKKSKRNLRQRNQAV